MSRLKFVNLRGTRGSWAPDRDRTRHWPLAFGHTSVGVKGDQGGGWEVRTNRQDGRLLFTRDGIVLSPPVLASAALPLPLVPLKKCPQYSVIVGPLKRPEDP